MIKLSNKKVKILQILLNNALGARLIEDGLYGKKTLNAILDLNVIKSSWSSIRKQIGALQHLIALRGVDTGAVDGFWGPSTQTAFDSTVDQLAKKPVWLRPDSSPIVPAEPEQITHQWPSVDPGSLLSFYGKPGQNHGKVQCPYPLKLAWNLDVVVNRFTAHEKIVKPVESVLTTVLDFYGIDEIKRLKLDLWGGCFNNRKVRGGSRISTHAYACSIDWNPVDNRLRWGKDKAGFAHPDYDFWWQTWENVGAVSLGRAKNFDWMHVQFAYI